MIQAQGQPQGAIENKCQLKRNMLNYFSTHNPQSTIHHSLLIAIIISVLLLAPISLVPVHAASSTNVTLENDIYRDMELWAAEGLIESNLYSIRPFARSEIGNMLVAAYDKCHTAKTPSATCPSPSNIFCNG